MIRRLAKYLVQRARAWLADPPSQDKSQERVPRVPFDNTYAWLGQSFEELMADPICRMRPAYIWGVLQGAALGKVLGLDAVSVVEFGVAGGAGLCAMERVSEHAERMIGIPIEVFGFDTGRGMPKTEDYRDCPNIWLDGQFAMDRSLLEPLLNRAQLRIGLVEDTVPEFIRSCHAPVAFVSFDLDLYSSTKYALWLFDADFDRLLPRVLCYFDDLIGLTYSDFNGERLAISEFNVQHKMRKLSPLYGLNHFLPSGARNAFASEQFYFAHFFSHPLYNRPDELRKPTVMDVNGKITGWRRVLPDATTVDESPTRSSVPAVTVRPSPLGTDPLHDVGQHKRGEQK